MRLIEAVFFHGWGVDSSFWEKWSRDWKGIIFSYLERGYFLRPQRKPVFVCEESYKILIAHSFGLHLIEEELFRYCDLLAILGGFETFVGPQRAQRAKVLSMAKKLDRSPFGLLNDFHMACGGGTNAVEACNAEILKEDLLLLEKSRLNLQLLMEIPRILIFHGRDDRIVPLEKGKKLKSALKNSIFFEIEKGSHFFPLGHAGFCIAKIEEFLPKENFKSEVARSFSSHSIEYEEHSHVQKRYAHILADEIGSLAIPEGPILEVGSATGYTSRLVLDLFGKREFIFCDISPSMIIRCKDKFSHYHNCSFRTCDGEKIELKGYFAMIFSSLTFQWFQDLSGSIKRLFSSLRPGGHLVFSFLEEACFPEWKEVCAACAISFNGKALPKIREAEAVIRSLDNEAKIELYKERVDFDSPFEFFENLKRTGAVAGGRKLSLFEWKKLLKKWRELFPHGSPITYVAVQVVMKRGKE